MILVFKLAQRHFLSTIPDENSMDIDSTLDHFDVNSASSSQMDTDYQIAKIEMNQGNEDIPVLKRCVKFDSKCNVN